MSKVIFLDVDGTLIDYEAKLPSSAAKAVDLARKNGHKVYICTGCSKAEILQRNLCELDGMIGGNGSYRRKRESYYASITDKRRCKTHC